MRAFNIADTVKQEVDCSVTLAKQIICNTTLASIHEILPVVV